jgi:PHD/YefM family antitoxin component YafN of YafNO toxin-antitoxin module
LRDLIDDEDWLPIQETLYLRSVPGMRESIVEGIKTSHTKMAKTLKW